MKIFLVILVLVLVAALAIADYKWRQWMAARKLERDGPVVGDPFRRRDRQ
jgi:hypothetical protein